MRIEQVSFKESDLFSKLFLDLAEEKQELKAFVNDFVSVDAVRNSLNHFDIAAGTRKALSEELKIQYAKFRQTDLLSQNIDSIVSENTFTVTTGHQLCLFTGPAYFICKIISCIKTCRELNEKIAGKKFVPVYWMATEDHDLEEINHAYFFGKKVEWTINGKGRAGELSTKGLKEVLQALKPLLGESTNAEKIYHLFYSAYAEHSNLADATRFLVNELFGGYGLVILDGNSHKLKQFFAAEMEEELKTQSSFTLVNKSIAELEAAGYAAQVSPREINLFYAEKNLRERIVEKNGMYEVLNTDKKFAQEEVLKLLKNSPELFSPNVVLRPLYQQKILPNVIYCGGPGELAYWLQYKSLFAARKISFPFLLARNFVLMLDEKALGKWTKLGFTVKDLFRPEEELIKDFVRSQSGEISLSKEKADVETVYAGLEAKAAETDKTLVNFVLAEKQKVLNSLSATEAKLNKALKQKNETGIAQLSGVLAKVFPNGIFQERRENFFAFAISNTDLLEELIKELPSALGNRNVSVLIS